MVLDCDGQWIVLCVEWICLENFHTKGEASTHQGPSVVWRIEKDLRRDQREVNVISLALVNMQVQSYCSVT